MSPKAVPGWRLVGRQGLGLGPSAIDAALARDAATLSCGPHTFDFAKAHTALDDVQLRLSHRRDCACDARTSGLRRVRAGSVERLVPAVTGDLDDATRAHIEADRLSVAGRALFSHVAHLVALAEDKPPGKRTLRFLPVSGGPCRKQETFARGRICTARGCGTVLSVYNPSRSCELHGADGLLEGRDARHVVRPKSLRAYRGLRR